MRASAVVGLPSVAYINSETFTKVIIIWCGRHGFSGGIFLYARFLSRAHSVMALVNVPLFLCRDVCLPAPQQIYLERKDV